MNEREDGSIPSFETAKKQNNYKQIRMISKLNCDLFNFFHHQLAAGHLEIYGVIFQDSIAEISIFEDGKSPWLRMASLRLLNPVDTNDTWDINPETSETADATEKSNYCWTYCMFPKFIKIHQIIN